MAYTHGVYVQERDTPIITPVTADSAVQFAVGTAPVHQLADPVRAVNRLTLIHNLQEFVEAFGWSDDFENYTLCQVASASFQVFNVAPLVIVNVFDPVKHASPTETATLPLENGSARLSARGVIRSSVTVKADAGGDDLTEDAEYALEYAEDGVTIVALPGGGISGDIVQVTYSAVQPAAIADADVIGGYDASSGAYTGLELVRQCYPQFGIVPGTLIAPGFSQRPAVGAALIAKTAGINGVYNALAIADIDTALADTYDKVKAWKDQNGYTDPRLVCCWPMAAVGGKTYHLSALLAARIAKTDSENEGVPFVSPSNKGLPISATVTESGEVYLDQTQGNYVNGCGVVTAINLNGWRLWGNNTSAYPGVSDPKDRWISVRRMFNWWGNSFISTYFQKVDNPANRRLIQSIIDSENLRANGYVARGMIAGAKIEYMEGEGPATDVMNGTLRFKQSLTPYPPAETIVNVLEFDPNALKAALGGEDA